jgi:hypothetical protein
MAYTFRWVPTTGQSNSFVENNNTGKGYLIVDQTQQNPFDSPLYICVPPISFAGGNGGGATLYDFARTLATCGVYSTVANPGTNYNGNKIPTGGAFTLNGTPCGNYEFNILPGGTTLTQATVANLFSSTQDISTWIICKGNLTVPASVVLIPNVNPSYLSPATETSPDSNAKRRLFMVIYVTGNLTLADSTSIISMTACGGNTSATGTNIGTFNIPIASNLYYLSTPGITPTIQASGSAGGSGASGTNGNSGVAPSVSADGSQLQTAGGGSGFSGGATSGAGGTGSAFSSGTGGGSVNKTSGATSGSSLGGAGGDGASGGTGGTGNPGGTGAGASGNSGTGGVLIIISEGTISSSGTLKACGIDAVNNAGQEGGSSGGGIVALIQSSSTATSPSVRTVGGSTTGAGGKGAAGTTYKYGINS